MHKPDHRTGIILHQPDRYIDHRITRIAYIALYKSIGYIEYKYLFDRGTKLTSFYVSSPICSPSRDVISTGRFQTQSGVWPGVPEQDATVDDNMNKPPSLSSSK